MTNEGDQQDIEESEVAQQPTYDNSYPTGLTVKWKRFSEIKLVTIIGHDGDHNHSKIPVCKIRFLTLKMKCQFPYHL